MRPRSGGMPPSHQPRCHYCRNQKCFRFSSTAGKQKPMNSPLAPVWNTKPGLQIRRELMREIAAEEKREKAPGHDDGIVLLILLPNLYNCDGLKVAGISPLTPESRRTRDQHASFCFARIAASSEESGSRGTSVLTGRLEAQEYQHIPSLSPSISPLFFSNVIRSIIYCN
jgi:hypothetical protein